MQLLVTERVTVEVHTSKLENNRAATASTNVAPAADLEAQISCVLEGILFYTSGHLISVHLFVHLLCLL